MEGNFQYSSNNFRIIPFFLGKLFLKDVITLKAISRSYEIVVGLKVNFFKSKLGGVEVDPYTLKRLAKYLNCNIMEVPFTFLGIPVGANPKKKRD